MVNCEYCGRPYSRTAFDRDFPEYQSDFCSGCGAPYNYAHWLKETKNFYAVASTFTEPVRHITRVDE